MEWPALADALGLRAEQAPAVRDLIDAAKDRFPELCRLPAAGSGTSPLEFVVACLRELPRPEEPEIAARFFDFLAGERDAASGRPFAELCGEADREARQRVSELLDEEQRERLSHLPLESLLDVATGHDPLGEAIRRCMMAGEEPAAAATAAGAAAATEARYEGLFCSQPFDYAQVEPDGNLYLCCPQTLPEPVGNVAESGLMAAWNSEKAGKVRASILDGTYRYCSAQTCGLLQQRLLPRAAEVTDGFHRQVIEHRLTRLERGPRTINMSYDRTCNLACPSCRSGLIVLRGARRERAARIHERVVGEHMRDARRLIITGSGDPFGSHLYLGFLRAFAPQAAPALRIQLSTNGLLLNRAMWESICHPAVDWIDVSVDAATPETYAQNRGGDFARLLDNLAFIGELRARGKLRLFQLHYVVQANNYREMRAFVELGLALGCDRICFKQLVNWGTYSTAEFGRRAVQRSGHPEHEEFLAQLRDPLLAHPRVYMHDLSRLKETAVEAASGRRPVP
jgi:MoaA/NifB/PqqE/SkfB family radical SAM enzyme